MDKQNLIEVVACVKGGVMTDKDGKEIQLYRCVRLYNDRPIEDEYITAPVSRGFYLIRCASKWLKVVDDKGTIRNKQVTIARIGDPVENSADFI